MIGPRIKYLVFHADRPIAALSYNRAALHVDVRDSFLNWTPAQKLKLLPHVVNNNHILPWVRVKNLASHLLARTLKRLRQDWPRLSGTAPFLVETFVDPQYRGTCYQAANWLYLGETRGFARVGKTYIQHGKPKSVFVYLLHPAFLKIIAEDPCRHPNPQTVGKRVPNMMLHQPDFTPGPFGENWPGCPGGGATRRFAGRGLFPGMLPAERTASILSRVCSAI